MTWFTLNTRLFLTNHSNFSLKYINRSTIRCTGLMFSTQRRQATEQSMEAEYEQDYCINSSVRDVGKNNCCIKGNSDGYYSLIPKSSLHSNHGNIIRNDRKITISTFSGPFRKLFLWEKGDFKFDGSCLFVEKAFSNKSFVQCRHYHLTHSHYQIYKQKTYLFKSMIPQQLKSRNTASGKVDLSECNQRRFTTQPKAEDIIEAWFQEVKTFGSIDIQVPFPVHVESLDPMEYPDMNKLMVEVYKNHDKVEKKMSLLSKLYELDINSNEDKDQITIKMKIVDDLFDRLPVCCYIKLPIKFNIFIKSENEKVTVNNFEADKISVCSNLGSIYLNKIKCGEVDINSNGGDIISKSLLQGNINLSTCITGEIVGERLQGQNISCYSEEGKISLHTLYSIKTDVSTTTGDLYINSCHGDTISKTQSGNLYIKSLDGDLYHTGNNSQVDIGTTRCNHLHVNTDRGNVKVKVDESIKGELQLTANTVTIDDDVMVTNKQELQSHQLIQFTGTLNGGEEETSKIKIKTNQGKITLHKHNWFSSLNLS